MHQKIGILVGVEDVQIVLCLYCILKKNFVNKHGLNYIGHSPILNHFKSLAVDAGAIVGAGYVIISSVNLFMLVKNTGAREGLIAY